MAKAQETRGKGSTTDPAQELRNSPAAVGAPPGQHSDGPVNHLPATRTAQDGGSPRDSADPDSPRGSSPVRARTPRRVSPPTAGRPAGAALPCPAPLSPAGHSPLPLAVLRGVRRGRTQTSPPQALKTQPGLLVSSSGTSISDGGGGEEHHLFLPASGELSEALGPASAYPHRNSPHLLILPATEH